MASAGPSAPLAFNDGLRQLAVLGDAGAGLDGSVLELGSGWLPIIPLLFHIAGARRIILTDAERLLDDRTIGIARQFVRARLPAVAAALRLSRSAAEAALDRPFQPAYFAPWKAGDLAGARVDMVMSRCVLEHIPPRVLEDYLIAFRNVVRPGGWMCHTVDNSDHWQHINHSRSPIQFLCWRQGGVIERFGRLSHYGYTNRLRHSDYLALFHRSGWEIVRADGEPDPRSLEDAKRLRLAAPFDTRDPRDLAILSSCFVVRNPPAESCPEQATGSAAADRAGAARRRGMRQPGGSDPTTARPPRRPAVAAGAPPPSAAPTARRSP